MNLNNSTTPEDEKDLAQTPTWFVEAAERALRVRFVLDVCALPETAKCEAFFSMRGPEPVNSLAANWSETGWNWCNPPYSDITPWVSKAAEQAEAGCSTALLIPDKPEVGYTRQALAACDTAIHMPFRLNFLRPDGTPFLTSAGKPQGPKFPVALYLFTPQGLHLRYRDEYIDFREYRDER